MRIGVFDSGIGGITVLKKLINKYPNCEYIYYGDTKNFPFGNKSVNELKNIATNIIDFLISKKVDIIVIACGTISSNILDYLKDKYSIPIFDIISGTLKYVNESQYNNIGILCTEKTKESKIFEKNINKKISIIPSGKLATLIENNKIEKIDKYIKKKLEVLNDKDLIILGCTHYPLIINIIKKYIKTTILDMADCIKIDIIDGITFKLELYFTKMDELILNNIKVLLKDYEYKIKANNL